MRLRCALRLNGFDQEGVERIGTFRSAQFVDQRAIAQQTRYSGQRLEMVGSRALRRYQQKNDIDRPLVDGVEIDWRRDSREQPVRSSEARHAAVRDGDAAADARRSQTLTLDQEFEQAPFVDAIETGCTMRQFCQ